MADTVTVTLPQISINGTSPTSLVNGYCEIAGALRALRAKLAEHGPNGRDYQYNPAAFQDARREHEARLASVEHMLREFDTLANYVADTRHGR